MPPEITDLMVWQWANLTAVGALIVVVLYLITKGLPSMLEKFAAILQEQRNDYREEMRLHREETSALVKDGHVAIDKLATNIQDLTGKLISTSPISLEKKMVG